MLNLQKSIFSGLIYFDPSSQVNGFFFKSCYPDKSAIKTSPFDESILFVSIDLRLLPNMGPLQWEAQEITQNYCCNLFFFE